MRVLRNKQAGILQEQMDAESERREREENNRGNGKVQVAAAKKWEPEVVLHDKNE